MSDRFMIITQEAYLELIKPINIYNSFKTEECFINWLEKGTIQDLNCTLQAFEQAELYEQCIIVNKVIKQRHGQN